MNVQTVTSSLINEIALVVSMAECMKSDNHTAMLLALNEAVGKGGDLPVHYQLALLPINHLDELHTKILAIFRGEIIKQ